MTLNGTNGHQNGYHAGELAATLIDVQPTAAQAAAYLKVQQAQAELDAALRGDVPEVPHFVFRNLTDALDLPETEWLVPGLIAHGSLVLLSAAPKSGKTFLVLGMLNAAAHGGRFLGMDIPQISSWLFSEQSDRVIGAQLRMLKFERTDKIEAAYRHEQPDFDSNEQFADALYSSYMNATERPGIIVIDTLAAFVDMSDLNDYASVKRELDPIVQCANAIGSIDGTATLLTHHDRKALGNGSDAVLGSRWLAGVPDTLLYLTARPTNGRRRLRIQSRLGVSSLGDQVDVLLHLPTGEFRVVSDAADRAVVVLEAMEAGCTKRKDIGAHIEASDNAEDISDSILTKTLSGLVDAGDIERVGKGKATEYRLLDE